VAAPSRGRISFASRAPFASPALRQRTASLLADEPSFGAGTVGDWLRELEALRGGGHAEELRRLGFQGWQERLLASLGAGERRTLALAVALSHANAELVLLHEPLTAAAGLNAERVLERVQELAAHAVVLVTTQLAADARRFGGTLYLLERGALVRSPAHAWPAELTPGLGGRLVIDSDGPRALVRELISSEVVSSIHYALAQAPRRVSVRGPDLDALALAVMAALRRAGVTPDALRLAAGDLDSVHSASQGLARAAYEAAYSTGQDAWRQRRVPREPPPPPPGVPSPQ
jgi:hypothetical protein